MENMNYRTKMIGIVTLYNPESKTAAENIKRYIDELDALVVWDNSALDLHLKSQLQTLLGDSFRKVIWHGTGENTFIASAINYTWQLAKEQGYDLLLIMDQDSQWDDFTAYRRQIEANRKQGHHWVFTPYVAGNDEWSIKNPIHFRRMFINSGTVIPTDVLTTVGGADETFPLDALDCDLSIRIQKAGIKIACITPCILFHTLGSPSKSEKLHLMTNNYNILRTYSITRGHLRLYRRHKDWLNWDEKIRIIKENLILRFIRIILLETNKREKLRMFVKGIKDGICENNI